MYEQFQATPVQCFDDPVVLARIIADDLGADFKEPDDPGSWLVATQLDVLQAPRGLDSVRFDSPSGSRKSPQTGSKFEFNVSTGATIAYQVIEGWSFLDALFMVAITLTTVGFGEVHPLTDAGRLMTLVLVVFGVSGALYAIAAQKCGRGGLA